MQKFFIAIIMMFLSSNILAEGKVLKLGVVPQQSASSLAKVWLPLTLSLSEKTGYQIRFATAPNIPEFEKRVAAGEYDITYLNPYHYTVFSKSIGLRAIARQKDKRIHGIMVVRKDSDISDLSMLSGVEVAFPAPAAFAATVLPQAHLRLEGVSFMPQYVSSHDSVYSGVVKGLFLAGGGIDRTLSTFPKAQSDQLKVIWRSKGYTPHAFAVSEELSDEETERIQSALLSLNSQPEGMEILTGLGFKTGLMKSEDSDWNDVRALEIDLLK
ncbi:phosphate/phosphite/phosphonate ABC transporter substrate-binding protein [Psychromonas sp. 14N.309.X.WAT.B.A12]|uniref:phosphate/phosphite/phosphonate ABC transporter substrate-binding protein n=1 Tax=Psychromonas sp. 14N.309.X.WAT.B.A12 TaxID=2998322 RepID=UPI0025B10E7E|nr:phosphate/phosphite/phosphonate ABC transporter substrate-binding protein [Psychromonas sp. 14N.309.X.WAT.B.A12]MDN2663584.1 phosphate/phosphite/phosphonate ABC transporter substrate-binding protein [Psychromonas sp. 14N.309.X.WAT.B.A12]